MSSVVSSPPTTPSVAPAAPPSPQRRQILTFPGVANLFVGLKRAQARSTKPKTSTRSPPSSPKASKIQSVISNSGDTLQTHSALSAEGTITSPRRVALEVHDTFTCAGAVDAAKLLRLSRETLLERAHALGANALVDESWTCTIHGPKGRNDSNYRVQIHYTAAAARANKDDPRKPIALDQAKSVPGLMTVISRTH